MPLPKIDLPILELTLPSSGDKIKYRPFTVKEEKILLVAQESGDPAQEILASKQVVNNCLIDTDVSSLAMFDLEYVMLLIRAQSVSNALEFTIKDDETGEEIALELDINDVKITKDELHTNKIKISDEYTLFLKYPTIDEFIKIAGMNQDDPLIGYFIMVTCLDSVASDSEVFKFTEYTTEQIEDFMGDMSGKVIKGIEEFFDTIPKLRHELKYTNSKGTEKTFVIEGMKSFFI